MMRRAVIAAALLAGCVEEHDVETWLLLPDMPSPCVLLGAARARVAVDSIDGEKFEVTSDACYAGLGGGDASGFHLGIPALADGFHRVRASIEGVDGTEIGAVDRPFAADRPLLLFFSRGDLPGWPDVPVTLAVDPCASHPGLDAIEITVTGDGAARPASVATFRCDALAAPLSLAVPAGPDIITATGFDELHTACWHGALQVLATPDAELSLPLTRSCP